jgi:flagellar hook-associated protein 1 FlgK
MPDVLATSTSALVAFQRALAVTGNNIANANTEGYSRQRIELASRPPQGFGFGFIGNGVDVTSIRRIMDQFATTTLRESTTQLGQLTAFADFAGRVDNVTGDTNAGLSASLQSFFNAWQTVANDPASVTNRQVLIGQASALADRFQQLSSRLESISRDAVTQVQTNVREINSLALSIAKLNDQITVAQAANNGQPPNDLLDARDQLLLQLGRITNVQTNLEPDGALSVFVGTGQALVLRAKAFSLAVVPNQFDASRVDIAYQGAAGNQTITQTLSGGALGGLLQVQSQLIDPALNGLGRIAAGVASLVNAQQAQGFDLRGQFGGPMFSAPGPGVLASSANAGAGALTATVSDLSAVGTNDWQLRWNGTTWFATDTVTGATVTPTGAGTIASPLVVGGLSIVLTGAPAAGDSFLVRPVRDAAGSFRSLITDPRAIAAASPIRTSAAATNVGTGLVSAGEVLDVADPALLATVNIQFLTAGTYSVNGGPAQAYTAGANIDVNGWRLQITGAPAAGDTFTVQRNAGGLGDNRNALAMAALASRGLFDGGGVSISQAYSALVADVGNDTRQAQLARDAQTAITNDAQQAVNAAAGVNLDEEAADLLKWQQAYGAAAKVVAVADDLFNTLLSVVRR